MTRSHFFLALCGSGFVFGATGIYCKSLNGAMTGIIYTGMAVWMYVADRQPTRKQKNKTLKIKRGKTT